MKTRFLLALMPPLAAVPAAAAADPVPATYGCLARAEMVDLLVEEYGEQLAEVHQTPGGLLEFHISPGEGSWTALVTGRDGMSCVIAAGQDVDSSKTPVGNFFYET